MFVLAGHDIEEGFSLAGSKGEAIFVVAGHDIEEGFNLVGSNLEGGV